MFTSEFFAGNRLRLLQSIGGDLIVLSANGLLQRSADTTYKFRQDSNFWYLTGIEEPDYVLVINGGDPFLIAPKRSEHRDAWDGVVNKKQLIAKSGISTILEHHAGWNRLDLLLKKYKKVHTITPAETYIDVFGFYTNPARGALLAALAQHKKLEMVDIRKTIAGLRQIKQHPELEAIQKAIDITTKSLAKIQRKLPAYRTEYQIEADITRDFIRSGASGHAYGAIIAGGKNAATIHYMHNNQAIDAGEMVLMDVGAEYDHYGADISRTYSSGKPSKRQLAVHASVMNVHAKALKALRPGVDPKQYEQDMDNHMAKELKKLKLITDTTDKKALRKYYPHLTSHFLGLDTHDAADYTKPLEPGMILTVEPGIYIPDEGIGIRVEDNILITAAGNRVLSSGLATSLT